jgi:hypothetical protein
LEAGFPTWKTSMRQVAMQIHEVRSEVNDHILTDLASTELDVSGKLYNARRKREKRAEMLDDEKTEKFQADYRAGKKRPLKAIK